jgi:hypothetical protein
MPFGNRSEDKPKGEKPWFKGTIQEYQGKTQVALWPTSEFKKYMEELAK